MEQVLFSTVSVVTNSIQNEANIASEYKKIDTSPVIPGLTTDNILDLAAPTFEKLDFVTDNILDGLIKLTMYEDVYAVILTEYDELTRTWGNVIGVVGHDDNRGYVIIDGINSRVFNVGNLENEMKHYIETLKIRIQSYRFITFMQTIKKEVKEPEKVSTPKKKIKVETSATGEVEAVKVKKPKATTSKKTTTTTTVLTPTKTTTK